MAYITIGYSYRLQDRKLKKVKKKNEIFFLFYIQIMLMNHITHKR